MIIIWAVLLLIIATGLFIALVVYESKIMIYVGEKFKNKPELLFLLAAIALIIAGLIAKSMRT